MSMYASPARLRSLLLLPVLVVGLAACGDENPFTPVEPVEGTVTAQVGDPATNTIYVQLSNRRVTTVPVASWDLAFESRNGRNVLINTGKKARALSTGSADFAGVASTNPATYGRSWVLETTDGDLSRTAMGTDPQGTVFVLDLGSDAAGAPYGFRKVLIDQYVPGTSVRLRYSAMDGSGEQTRTISLSQNHNFTYVSLATGAVVQVEPERGTWDLAITPVTVRTGPPNAPVFRTSAAVITNRYDRVQVAIDDPSESMARNDDPTSPRNQMPFDAGRYTTVTRADFLRLGGHDAADAIGRNWFQILQPHSAGVYKVYGFVTYILKDPQGRHYALRFLSFVDLTTGRNGTVHFEYRGLE